MVAVRDGHSQVDRVASTDTASEVEARLPTILITGVGSGVKDVGTPRCVLKPSGDCSCVAPDGCLSNEGVNVAAVRAICWSDVREAETDNPHAELHLFDRERECFDGWDQSASDSTSARSLAGETFDALPITTNAATTRPAWVVERVGADELGPRVSCVRGGVDTATRDLLRTEPLSDQASPSGSVTCVYLPFCLS